MQKCNAFWYNKIMEINIKKLFNNLCCSHCKSEFDKNSIEIVHRDNDLLTINLTCKKCGKDFGLAYLRLSEVEDKEPLEIQDGPEPIDSDEVLDAHKFIKNLDKDWKKYLPKSE